MAYLYQFERDRATKQPKKLAFSSGLPAIVEKYVVAHLNGRKVIFRHGILAQIKSQDDQKSE
jgi:hypothetical protein